MKTFFLLVLVFMGSLSHAQNVEANANALATKMANKMKDSLNLSPDQRNHIRNINLKLHQEKMTARKQFANNRNSLGRSLQTIESTRDARYKMALNDRQFQLYKQKKRVFISAN